VTSNVEVRVEYLGESPLIVPRVFLPLVRSVAEPFYSAVLLIVREVVPNSRSQIRVRPPLHRRVLRLLGVPPGGPAPNHPVDSELVVVVVGPPLPKRGPAGHIPDALISYALSFSSAYTRSASGEDKMTLYYNRTAGDIIPTVIPHARTLTGITMSAATAKAVSSSRSSD
jgi:hypothetical protein